MKLKELKEATWEEWEQNHLFHNAVVQPEQFKPEIRQQGDLRLKSTWETAYCRIRAANLMFGYLDSWELLTLHLNIKEGDQDYPYRHQIFDEFLKHPGAIVQIRSGLEQLFSQDFTPAEREQANGFLELAQAATKRRTLDGGTIGTLWRLPESA